MNRADYERIERAKCAEKVAWTTQRLAANAVLLWTLAGYTVEFYPCPWCPAFHLTTSIRSKPMTSGALDQVAARLR